MKHLRNKRTTATGMLVLAVVLTASTVLVANDEKKDKKYEGPTGQAVGGVDNDKGGTIVGQVIFAGPKVPRKPIKMSADPKCAAHHGDDPPRDQRWVWGEVDVKYEGKEVPTLVNAFVYLAKGPSLEKEHKAPKEAAVLDQEGCRYTPHVLGMMAGQTLKIVNSDNTAHNVRYNSKNNGTQNISQPVKGASNEVSMKKAEKSIQVGCDVHPWMNANIHVMEHPFFAVSDNHGKFKITGLEPGEYEITTLHEFSRFDVRERTIKVKVEAGKEAQVQFVYYAPKRK